jgi:hypothetical protein
MCIENKRGTQLTQSQSVLGRPLLALLYRWTGLEEPAGLSHPKIWNVKINKNRNHVCLSGFKISQGIKTF